MVNSGANSEAVVINCGSNSIIIWPDTIGTGTISVRNSNGSTLWQKANQDYTNLHEAIEVARFGIHTGIFES
jgi:hypothetical protein